MRRLFKVHDLKTLIRPALLSRLAVLSKNAKIKGIAVPLLVLILLFTVVTSQLGRLQRFFSPNSLDDSFISCMHQDSLGSEIACVHSKAREWVRLYGPAAVGAELSTYQARFGGTEACHQAGHEVGAAIFEAEGGDLAKTMEACAQGCDGGCVHGAVLSYMAAKGASVFLALNPVQVCAVHSADQFHVCVHGFGHGYMVAENYDIARALALCDGLHVSAYDKERCGSGVFMELFNAALGIGHTDISPSLYTKKDDLFYPCTTPLVQKNRSFAEACFAQQVRLLVPYAKAHQRTLLQTCALAPVDWWQSSCAAGVGRGIAFLHSNNFSEVSQVCDSAPTDAMRKRCLYGAYELTRIGADGFAKAKSLCASFSAQDQVVCDPFFSERERVTQANSVRPMPEETSGTSTPLP